MTVSAVLHAAVVVGLIVGLPEKQRVAMPPVYRVELVAAPPGPRAIGVVNPEKVAPAETPPPARALQKAPAPSTQKAPPQRTKQATATTPRPPSAADRKAEQAKAGGGDVGGRGTDVVNLKIDSGLDFPFPSYLQNIVNQIYSRFPQNWPAAYSADVAFLIRRDGSITALRLTRRSGSYDFDLEAQGAIEAAGRVRAFGPLPEGFFDDVLPVVFSFDPKIIR